MLEVEKIDVVIHCANDTGPDAFRVNVDGTRQWMEEARTSGAELQIFLSSLLAVPDAYSDYGRAKFELEGRFVDIGEVVFKPGLVIGNGGMFSRVVTQIQRLPVVPLLDGGKAAVYITGIDFLCTVIREAIRDNGGKFRARPWRLHQPTGFSLAEVMDGIRSELGLRRFFLPVPSAWVLIGIKLLEFIPGIRLPISSSNVKGLQQSGQNVYDTDFHHFGYPEERLEVLIRKALAVEPRES